MQQENKTTVNVPLAIGSAGVLLVVSSVLAFLGKPTEMGFAILAGALGLAFANINKIRKFKGAGFEAEMHEQIQAVLDKETEPEPESASSIGVQVADREKWAVLTALGNPKYTWRLLGGIAKEAKLDKETVETILSEFVQSGVAKRGIGRKGSMWTLTVLGRATLALSRNDGEDA